MIKSIELSNINQHKHTKVLLDDNINVIFAPNGTGKTTFVNFLKPYNNQGISADEMQGIMAKIYLEYGGYNKDLMANSNSKTKFITDTNTTSLVYRNGDFGKYFKNSKTIKVSSYSEINFFNDFSQNVVAGNLVAFDIKISEREWISKLIGKRNKFKVKIKKYISNNAMITNELKADGFSMTESKINTEIRRVSRKNSNNWRSRFFKYIALNYSVLDKDSVLNDVFEASYAREQRIKQKMEIELEKYTPDVLKSLQSDDIDFIFKLSTALSSHTKKLFGYRRKYQPGTNLRGFDKKEDMEEALKNINLDIAKTEKKRHNLSNFINKKLKGSSLYTKISFDDEMRIIDKKTGEKSRIILSNAEIRLLSLLKFIFNSKGSDLIVFDDPITSFDSINIYYFINLIYKINKEFKKSQLLILTHSYSLSEQFYIHSSWDKINFQQFQLEKNEVIVTKFKHKSKLKEFDELLRNTKEIELIPAVIRQFLEYLISTFSNNSTISTLICGNKLKFMNVEYECEGQMTAQAIHDLVHKKTILSKNVNEFRNVIFQMKKDVLKFMKKLNIS